MDDKLEFILEVSEKAFQTEQERMKNLSDKAEKYIGAIAVIVGFQLFDLNSLDLIDFRAPHNWLAITGLFLLGIAFVDIILSNRIHDYKSYPNHSEIKFALDNESADGNSVKTAFINTYLEAFEFNYRINNRRANLLEKSGALIAYGFGLIVIRYILDIVIR